MQKCNKVLHNIYDRYIIDIRLKSNKGYVETCDKWVRYISMLFKSMIRVNIKAF